MQAVVVSEYFLANPKVDRRGNPSHNQLLVKLGRISRCHKLGTVLAMPDLHSKAAPQIRRETVAADDKLLKRLSSWLWKDSKNCMRRSLLSLAEVNFDNVLQLPSSPLMIIRHLTLSGLMIFLCS